jgi:hypothetical protein
MRSANACIWEHMPLYSGVGENRTASAGTLSKVYDPIDTYLRRAS